MPNEGVCRSVPSRAGPCHARAGEASAVATAMSRSRHEQTSDGDEPVNTSSAAAGGGAWVAAAAAAGAGGIRPRVGRATAAVPMVDPATMSRMDLIMAFAPLLEERRIPASGTDRGC